MAPEQVLHQPLGPQTDIYALGVILFEMLSGQRPFNGLQPSFSGDTPKKIRWEQVNLSAPNLRIQNPNIPAILDSIVACCLRKDPTQRYASAVDLLNDLKRAQASLETPSPAHILPGISIPRSKPFTVAKTIPADKSSMTKPRMATQSDWTTGKGYPVADQSPALRRNVVPIYILLVIVMVVLASLFLVRPHSNTAGTTFPTPDLQALTVPWLERKAQQPEVPNPQPGQTYNYTIQMAAPEKLRWGFSWCANSLAKLDENLSGMEFHFFDQQNKPVNLDQFTVYNYKESTLVCRSFYKYVAESWADGQYQLSTDVIFLHTIDDGQDTYPAGTISYRYNLQISPKVSP